jgi:hypothetical protein
MEEDLTIFKNERRPKNFFKWEMTSISLKMKKILIFLKIQIDLILKMEDDLDFC